MLLLAPARSGSQKCSFSTRSIWVGVLVSKVCSYDYSTHLHVHDITNVLPNAPSPSLALAEETSALRLTEVLSRHTRADTQYKI